MNTLNFQIDIPALADMHVHHHTVNETAIEGKLDSALRILTTLIEQGNKLMANSQLAADALAELNTVTNTIAAAVANVVANDDAEDAAFKAEIQALKDKVAAGDAIVADDLAGFDSLVAGMGATKATLTSIQDALTAMGTVAADPIPEVEILPVEPTP